MSTKSSGRVSGGIDHWSYMERNTKLVTEFKDLFTGTVKDMVMGYIYLN